MSCGLGHRRCSDPVWLWLWCRPVATAPLEPLAWELPYASSAALKRKKKSLFKFSIYFLFNFAKLYIFRNLPIWYKLSGILLSFYCLSVLKYHLSFLSLIICVLYLFLIPSLILLWYKNWEDFFFFVMNVWFYMSVWATGCPHFFVKHSSDSVKVFWGEITFRLVDWVNQIALHNVCGSHLIRWRPE